MRIFGSPEKVCTSSISMLMKQGGMSESLAQAIITGPDSATRSHIEKEVDLVHQGKWSFVNVLDETYPSRLKMIADPSPLLYMTGTTHEDDQNAIAIVGARKASPQGLTFTEELSRNLASLGLTIVSGLARGVDAAAHRGALRGGGRTLAVLGCGIDRTYPPEHRSLREEIENRGAVLSEFPVGTPPRGYHFPKRNRLISGLCLGVVVTEAAIKSGSLITARFALEQNREVFAVPGSVKGNKHSGPHGLIKQGAKLVEDHHDTLEELLPQLDHTFRERVTCPGPQQAPAPQTLGPEEQAVFQLFSDEPLSVDELMAQARFLPTEVMSILLSLELKGIIRQLPGSQYIRVSTT